MDILLRPCGLHAALRQLCEQDYECLGKFFWPSACIRCRRAPDLGFGTGGSSRGAGSLPNDRAACRWRIRFIKDPPRGRAHLAKDDLGEFANHHAFLSLPAWEIALGLHDTAQTEQTRPRSVGREGPGTVAQAHQRARDRAWEGRSSARVRRAGDHSDNGGPPREPVGARRRGRRAPLARRRDSPRPGSWHALPEMQYTVRFVLGLKGTLSEAELHILRARLRGGLLNKAQRAALKIPLPMGLGYAEDDTVILDPDAQIQHTLRVLFATFKRTGSACATVKYFRDQGLLFPRRIRTGPHVGEIHWAPLLHSTMLKVLRNPRYAGAFCFGRTHTTKRLDGSHQVKRLPHEQWPFLIRETHAGYISWEEYEANLEQLRSNRQAHGGDRRHGPPREGPALLQGLVICGRCGNRMTVRYHQHTHGIRLYPEYMCQKEKIEYGEEKLCQHILGAGPDSAIVDLLLAHLTPLAVDTTMQVYEELHTQAEAAQRLRAKQVERARYAAELAQRRFLRVDPENRLVADVLEADWNARLRELAEVQQETERQQEAEQRKLSALEQQAISELVADFPRVWNDERTSDRDRKRMVRLLLEDVTLRKDEVITAQLRFPGGATQTVTLPISQGRRSTQEVITLMDQLLDDYTDAEVAEQLNQRGWRTYEGKLFHATRVLSLRRYNHLKDHGARLRERGFLSATEAAQAYGVSPETIRNWGRTGCIPMYHADGRGIMLFPPPGEHPHHKYERQLQQTR